MDSTHLNTNPLSMSLFVNAPVGYSDTVPMLIYTTRLRPIEFSISKDDTDWLRVRGAYTKGVQSVTRKDISIVQMIPLNCKSTVQK